MKVQLDKDLKLIVLRWEFLKRNPQYIEDYLEIDKGLEKRAKKRGYYIDVTEIFGDSFMQRTKKERDFCIKWNIRTPVSPNYNPFDLLQELGLKGKVMIELNPLSKSKKLKTVLTIKRDGYTGDISEDFLHYAYHDLFDKRFLKHAKTIIPFLPIRPLYFESIVNDNLGWTIDFDGKTFNRFVSRQVATTGQLPFMIDLRHDKQKILDSFKKTIDKWKPLYEAAYRSELFRKFCNDKNVNTYPVNQKLINEFNKHYKLEMKNRLPKERRLQDSELYDKYLQVWDLKKKEKKSWSQIQKILNLNSIQTARDYHKAACKLIDEGLPL